MNFEDRKVLVDFLSKVESKYPIEKWIVDGVNIWPIIKTVVFFNELKKKGIVPLGLKIKQGVVSIIKFLKLDFIQSFIHLKSCSFKKVDFLFSGFSGHRVMWNGKFFNRYFDPIIDYLYEKKKQKSFLFEYDKKGEQSYYETERVVDVTKFYGFFRCKLNRNINFGISGLPGCLDFLQELSLLTGTEKEIFIEKIEFEVKEVFIWKKVWAYILKQIEPKYAYMLCYYNMKMFGLILAGKEFGLKSVDMQHGGQGDFHVAYNYNNCSTESLQCLPDYFWVWDKTSFSDLEKVYENSEHRTILGGNPWIDFLKNQDTISITEDRQIILYTMQPIDGGILHKYIIDGIKETTGDYVWWLRLHPRTNENERAVLYNMLKEEGLFDKVVLEEATKYPLPLILAKCTVHLSHFSGSVLEAKLMNVPTNIVVGNTGKEFYGELIDNNEVDYFDDIIEKEILFSFIKKCQKEKERVIINTKNYKSILDEIE